MVIFKHHGFTTIFPSSSEAWLCHLPCFADFAPANGAQGRDGRDGRVPPTPPAPMWPGGGEFQRFHGTFRKNGKIYRKIIQFLYIYIIRYNYIYISYPYINIYIYIYPQSCIKMGIDMDWPGQVFVHCGWFFMMILDGIMRYLYDVFSWWFDKNLHRFYRNLYGIP